MRKASISGITAAPSSPTRMSRRAVLIFAEDSGLDLARRGLPNSARPLLKLPLLDGDHSLQADVHVFNSDARAHSDTSHVHAQRGRNFAERFENAIETIHSLGYDEVVAVGRDCPHLLASDIALAFEQLQSHRLILGPDHRGGCYLIGFRSRDRNLLRRILWKQNTDCAQLRERCGEGEVFLLPVKHDLDSWADVRLFARLGDAVCQLAVFLVRVALVAAREISHFVDLAAQCIRIRGQMPPPVAA